MKLRSAQGTTLVEVVVGSLLLVSIIGIITLTLAAVFEGYAATQARSAVDQDGQYILARFRYAATQQNLQRLYGQSKPREFANEDALLTNLQEGETDDDGIFLVEGSIDGEYISPIISLPRPTSVDYFIATTRKPADTSITYQIAVAEASGGSCDQVEYTYVGPGGDESTFFSQDYFEVPKQSDAPTYRNPGSCIRYKSYFNTQTTETPTLQEVVIGRW